MADIEIICGGCEKKLTVSEFVDPTALSCPNCGSKLKTPPGTRDIAPPEKKRNWKLRNRPETDKTAGPERSQLSLTKQTEEEKKEEKRFKKSNRARGQRPVVGWVLFIVLGVITGVTKWCGFIDEVYVDMLRAHGALILIVFYVFVVFRAFEDSAFSGILSLAFPPYSLYYLFAVSDDYVLRGVLAGLMVGLGYDCTLSMMAYSEVVLEMVNRWILSGGGGVR